MEREKLVKDDTESVIGGQIYMENVMGVKGLSMCTGAATEKNLEGVYWKRNGISLTKEEAMALLKKESTRSLNEKFSDEAFLARYIENYNNQIDGYTHISVGS